MSLKQLLIPLDGSELAEATLPIARVFADRVTNICERVVYQATGQLEEVNGPPAKAGGCCR
jgi:hypothetical protein